MTKGQLGVALEQRGQLGDGNGRLVEFGDEPVDVLIRQHRVPVVPDHLLRWAQVERSSSTR